MPEAELSLLASETKVDLYSKKLQSEVILKLILHCLVSHKQNSLRGLSSAYESIAFKLLNHPQNKGKIQISSISERLSTMNPIYFERLFGICVERYKEYFGEQTDTIIKFDSTIVALSSLLLKNGYQLKGGDASKFNQLKFTVGHTDIPEIVHFYTDIKYTSENAALKETMQAHSKKDKSLIKVFDRGITSRNTYDELTEKGVNFISRLSIVAKHEMHSKNILKQPVKTSTLIIQSDCWVFLYKEKGIKSIHPVRRIEATRIKDGQQITFVTNLKKASASEITKLYKRRWEIEIFFKFIKQELNFSHLINRSENGIRVMLYITMIAAVLLLVYKKTNNLSGYKMVKIKFAQELEEDIIKTIIILSGGNLEKVEFLFKNNSS